MYIFRKGTFTHIMNIFIIIIELMELVFIVVVHGVEAYRGKGQGLAPPHFSFGGTGHQ